MRLRALHLTWALVLPLTAAAAPQDFDVEAVRASKRVAAVRTTEPIVVDGVLDEAAWSLAEPAVDFHQQFPDEFAPATERSTVRFLYDNEMLYIGATLHDGEPDRLIIDSLRRDFSNFQTDSFLVVLDTFLDQRNGYGFVTNAAGAQRDVQASDNGRRNDGNWDGAWIVRSTVTESGWSTEMAVPFKTLRFPPGDEQQWGLNMQRVIRRKNEFVTWSPVPRQFSHYAVGYAGLLTGISGIQSGSDLRVTPFTTGQFASRISGTAHLGQQGRRGRGYEMGCHVVAAARCELPNRLLPGRGRRATNQSHPFQSLLSGKTSVLSREPGELPDRPQCRRGRTSGSHSVLQSQIGLSASGLPIPVIGGLRLTGRPAGYGIGLLTMQTDEDEGQPGANYTVARLRRDVTNTAAVGAFYFGREATGSPSFNRVAGVDLRLAPTPALEIEAFAMHSATAGAPSDWAGRTSFRLDTNAHRARMGLVHIGNAFRHDIGFVPRRGIATLFGGYERVLRPANTRAAIREHTLGVELDTTGDDQYQQLLTRVGSLTYGLQFRDGAQMNARVNSTYERLDAPFTVGPGLSIEAGEYAFENVAIDYRSDQSATLSGNVGLETGEYWSGNRHAVTGGVRFRLNEHVAASANITRNVIDLPQGSFTADLARFRLDWSFTPRMFLNAFVQYNGESDSWLSNIRFNLIHRPLSDIYVVWNETRLPGDTRRALMLKCHAPDRVLKTTKGTKSAIRIAAGASVDTECEQDVTRHATKAWIARVHQHHPADNHGAGAVERSALGSDAVHGCVRLRRIHVPQHMAVLGRERAQMAVE